MKFNAMTGVAVEEPVAVVVEVEEGQLWQTKPTLASRIHKVTSVSAERIDTLDVGGVAHQHFRTYPPAIFFNCHEPAVDWFLKDGTKVVVGGLYSCKEYKNREVKRIDAVGLKFVDGGLYSNDEGSRLQFQNLYTGGKSALSLELPDKVSDLLEVALNDLERIVRLPDYVIDMSSYRRPASGDARCAVCLAGAMLCTILRPDEALPNIEAETWKKLTAVDNLRAGQIDQAFLILGKVKPAGVPVSLPTVLRMVYSKDTHDVFMMRMRMLVVLLRSHGA